MMLKGKTKFLLLGAVSAATLAGCRGSAPLSGEAAPGNSAALIGARILTPEGESANGEILLNFESEENRYALSIRPGRTALLCVEPGAYRFSPGRNILGMAQTNAVAVIEGRSYRTTFPRDLLRMDAADLKPNKALAVGMLEAQLLPRRPKERPRLLLRLDTSIETRRRLIEDAISQMMDRNIPQRLRDNAVSWSRALEQALVRVQEEKEAPPSFKAP